MWTCRNCGTENEIKFKFCWSCGHTRDQSKPVEIKEEVKETPRKIEPRKEPVREAKKIEEVKKIEELQRPEEPKPIEIPRLEKRKAPQNEPELFASVLPYSARASNDETDWEIKVFRIAVRLVGLLLLYHVFVWLPDLVNAIYSAYEQSSPNADKIFTKELIVETAKLLFYFIVGIYLIASGRILLWLLPNR